MDVKHVDGSTFLGLVIDRDIESRTLRITQSHYARNILDDFGMTHCKLATTPGRPEMLTSYDGEAPKRYITLYMAVTGSLLFLAIQTRPDIIFHVCRCCKFSSNPGPQHWVAVKQILRYLRGTIDIGIVFIAGIPRLHTCAFSDSDFAGNTDDRVSTTGTLIKLLGGPVVWRSKLQSIVTRSSTETEYAELAETAREIQWLINMLQQLGVRRPRPFVVYEDNQSTINVAINHANHKGTKHVDLHNHLARSMHLQGVIDIRCIAAETQLADGLTKGLSPAKWANFLWQLGLK